MIPSPHVEAASGQLSSIHSHPRDSAVRFDAGEHVYTLPHLQNRRLISVTTLVNHFFEPFDADVVIRCMMNSPKWTASKYYGMTPEAIKTLWATNGRDASVKGTRLHAFIEACYNKADLSQYADLLPTPEVNQFQRFVSDIGFARTRSDDPVIPYRTEWVVYDESINVGGTIDMVYKNLKDGTYTLVDWKRCKRIHKQAPTNNGRRMAKGVMHTLPDCNFTKYSMQLNVYRYIVEKVYKLTVRDAYIVAFHPDQTTYHMHKVEPDPILTVILPRLFDSLRNTAGNEHAWHRVLADAIAQPACSSLIGRQLQFVEEDDIADAIVEDHHMLRRSDSSDTGNVMTMLNVDDDVVPMDVEWVS